MINAVAGSLIRQPNFRDVDDLTRRDISGMASSLAVYDGEFILKLALYTRCELNVRTTANFLLALASNVGLCRPYLRKYFRDAVRLPSDWIDVAELYQVWKRFYQVAFTFIGVAYVVACNWYFRSTVGSLGNKIA